MDYREQFKSCGRNVSLADDVHIEHPDVMEVGDHVTFSRGFYMTGKPARCRIGANVTFNRDCHIEGSPDRFIVEHDVKFYRGSHIELGNWPNSFLTIGHHSHFAPYGILYGWGGLTIGPYCNIAAHVVLATVGHHDEITDQPMALTGEKAAPITLDEDVWICANAVVTGGTRIARGCVIGANAVVTKDTEPNGIYGGVPARRLRDRG